MKNRHSGFTLIELLVVVAIIALLIAMILPQMSKAREEAKLVKCEANLHAIGTALAVYAAQNRDLMPTGQNFKYGQMHSGAGVPNPNNPWTWPTGGADDRLLLNRADALQIEGCLLEHSDVGGTGGAQGEFSTLNNGWSWQYPAFGYGIFQCPNHRADYQYGNGDGRLYQGYGLAWCAASNFDGLTVGGIEKVPYQPTYSSFQRTLNPNHIIVAEGNFQMAAWTSGGNPKVLGQYKSFQRHVRNNKLGGTYLMAGGQAEWSYLYGTYSSPAPGWTTLPVGARGRKDAWVHP